MDTDNTPEERAFRAGYISRKNKLCEKDDNPYGEFSNLRQHWETGWLAHGRLEAERKHKLSVANYEKHVVRKAKK